MAMGKCKSCGTKAMLNGAGMCADCAAKAKGGKRGK
jgi:NMD protein affecting ribosome stability and mRNA decay